MNLANYNLTEAEQARLSEVNLLKATDARNVTALMAMLNDPSWVVRRSVIETLAQLGEVALAPLCAALISDRRNEARIAAMVDTLVASSADSDHAVAQLADDVNPAVVADVAQILGRRRSQLSLPVLVKLLKHADDNVAVGAIEALGKVGGRSAIEALVTSIETGNFFRTFPAIDVLGRSGDPRVVEPLSKLLNNANYLPEAARALGRSGERSAMKPLISLLQSSIDAVLRVSALALADLRDRFEEKAGGDGKLIEDQLRTIIAPETVRRLARVLPASDVPESIALSKLLGMIGSAEGANQLAAKLDAVPSVATAAAEALKKIGVSADQYLRDAIREGQSERRKILLPVITRQGAIEEVSACLSDADPDVKVMACDTLARIGVTSVVPQIFTLLADANLRVVHAATAAIQALGSREARTLAVEATQSPNPRVRRAALNILAYFGDLSATEPMLRGLEDSDAKVREAALQGLPFLEDQRATEALYEVCRTPDARLRSLAMRSVGQIAKTTQRAYSVLLKGVTDSDAWVRYYACQSIGRLGYSAAAVDVAKLLSDEAGQVRVSAVEALSHLDSPEAHRALKIAVDSSDVDVMRAALVGLGIAKRLEDLPVLLKAANSKDSTTRLLALSALVGFRSPLVFGALSAAGVDLDEQVRSAAIGFLAARAEQEATEVLVELLTQERTRERAKTALMLASTGRISGLLVALESANDELAPIIVTILTKMGYTDSGAALIAAMKLNNPAARKAVAVGISTYVGRPEMMMALKEAAENDPDREVRQICRLLMNE